MFYDDSPLKWLSSNSASSSVMIDVMPFVDPLTKYVWKPGMYLNSVNES